MVMCGITQSSIKRSEMLPGMILGRYYWIWYHGLRDYHREKNHEQPRAEVVDLHAILFGKHSVASQVEPKSQKAQYAIAFLLRLKTLHLTIVQSIPR